jgi:hypothetical protein
MFRVATTVSSRFDAYKYRATGRARLFKIEQFLEFHAFS